MDIVQSYAFLRKIALKNEHFIIMILIISKNDFVTEHLKIKLQLKRWTEVSVVILSNSIQCRFEIIYGDSTTILQRLSQLLMID